ncbi:hypothetical protein EJ04DRAFT_530041 [Polyplosphaeria fusca]|uniref:Uncharacterized protein n=1 Tax=Polyplosphaeria fusca TaxID=682080 RepID=A0A9P4QJL5_9PLEO|nr:hypothetical protein EJ04DRAFT_530041 [Polyplosphaeria fusca]
MSNVPNPNPNQNSRAAGAPTPATPLEDKLADLKQEILDLAQSIYAPSYGPRATYTITTFRLPTPTTHFGAHHTTHRHAAKLLVHLSQPTWTTSPMPNVLVPPGTYGAHAGRASWKPEMLIFGGTCASEEEAVERLWEVVMGEKQRVDGEFDDRGDVGGRGVNGVCSG